jgi:hypothetical protein
MDEKEGNKSEKKVEGDEETESSQIYARGGGGGKVRERGSRMK